MQQLWNRDVQVQRPTGHGDYLHMGYSHVVEANKKLRPPKLIWSRAASSLADSSEAAREAPVELSTAVKPEVGSVAVLFNPD